MSPTLSPHFVSSGAADCVLIRQYTPSLSLLNPWYARAHPLEHTRATLSRGDIVAFRKPHDATGVAIKRVIALGGDKVIRHGSQKRRDQEAVTADRFGLGVVPDEIIVPRNHVWVESDNHLDNTVDSNVFGPIPANLVVGKVDKIVWPWDRRGMIGPRPRRRARDDTKVIAVDKPWMYTSDE
jgi:signal peptidase I